MIVCFSCWIFFCLPRICRRASLATMKMKRKNIECTEKKTIRCAAHLNGNRLFFFCCCHFLTVWWCDGPKRFCDNCFSSSVFCRFRCCCAYYVRCILCVCVCVSVFVGTNDLMSPCWSNSSVCRTFQEHLLFLLLWSVRIDGHRASSSSTSWVNVWMCELCLEFKPCSVDLCWWWSWIRSRILSNHTNEKKKNLELREFADCIFSQQQIV